MPASEVAPRAEHASPLCHRPESFAEASGKASAYTIGGSASSTFQSVERSSGPGA